jgi:hypothetical protein
VPEVDAVEIADGEGERGSCGMRHAARDAHRFKLRLKA